MANAFPTELKDVSDNSSRAGLMLVEALAAQNAVSPLRTAANKIQESLESQREAEAINAYDLAVKNGMSEAQALATINSRIAGGSAFKDFEIKLAKDLADKEQVKIGWKNAESSAKQADASVKDADTREKHLAIDQYNAQSSRISAYASQASANASMLSARANYAKAQADLRDAEDKREATAQTAKLAVRMASGDPDTIKDVIRIATTSENPYERKAAAEAFGTSASLVYSEEDKAAALKDPNAAKPLDPVLGDNITQTVQAINDRYSDVKAIQEDSQYKNIDSFAKNLSNSLGYTGEQAGDIYRNVRDAASKVRSQCKWATESEVLWALQQAGETPFLNNFFNSVNDDFAVDTAVDMLNAKRDHFTSGKEAFNMMKDLKVDNYTQDNIISENQNFQAKATLTKGIYARDPAKMDAVLMGNTIKHMKYKNTANAVYQKLQVYLPSTPQATTN